MRIIKLIAVFTTILVATIFCWRHADAQEQTSSPQQIEAKLATDPKNAKLQQQLGWAYFYEAREGNAASLDKAIQAFERSAELAPNDLSTGRGLGMAYFLKTAFLARGKAPSTEMKAAFEQTIAAFDRALARHPNDTLLLASHGSAMAIYAGVTANLEFLKQGVAEMNRAVELQPKAAHGRLFRAFTSINLPPAFRKSELVVEDFSMLIQHSASYNEQAEGVLRILLGDFYFTNKDAEKAKAEYTAAAQKGSAMADGKARLTMLANGGIEAAAIQQYRGNVTNCAICHKQ
jgi:tetratricopeptide (TPR) repeat protein